MSIKTKMHELKKELLLKEASTQFEEIGYEHMKIAHLAKVAGVSIGTIYTLFGSKEGLYLAYIEYQINTFFEELQKNTISDKDAKQRIYAFIELKFSYYQQKRKAIEQSASNNPLFFNTLYSEHSDAFQKIYKYLSECFVELNPKLDEDQAMRMAFALNGFSDGYISRWLEVDDELMDRVDEVCNLFVGMVKGYQ
jgi:AcrR family transcriptional regulator